ncbi:MAG: DUF2723 domain-containing protein [Candidatus Promineifilaceae bacterium]
MKQQTILTALKRPFAYFITYQNQADQKTVVQTAILVTVLFLAIVYLSTFQTHINGSQNPYATDVGEIQNALPRWGTIHLPGYPQYSFLGSLFVTILRPIMEPAVSASLYSVVWGLVAAVLLLLVLVELDISPWIAAGITALFGLSLSMWVDASIAEVHTMTMALLLALLLVGLRFYKGGETKYLYWLAFLCGTAVIHQRGAVFITLALLPLVWPHWRLIFGRLHKVIPLLLLGPVAYLYLWLVARLGVTWTYGSPGTWEGMKALFINSAHIGVLDVPHGMSVWLERAKILGELLLKDWPLYLLLPGVVGLVWPGENRLIRLGFLGGVITFLAASLMVWEGYVSDALLAIKMPAVVLTAVGSGWLLNLLVLRVTSFKFVLLPLLLVAVLALFFTNRQNVLVITRDTSRLEFIETIKELPPAADGRPQTMTVLWGHDYWALAYAQAYQGAFPDLNLITHDRNFAAVLERGDHLLTPSKTFFYRPVEEWERLIGQVHLAMVTPEIVELKAVPDIETVDTPFFDFGNGIGLKTADLSNLSPDELQLHLVWMAEQDNLSDYSVAVHLVTKEPPSGPDDILIQADRNHPVDGWYPTSKWQHGERIDDYYRLSAPLEDALSVRISLYQQVDGVFENSPWLSLPLK